MIVCLSVLGACSSGDVILGARDESATDAGTGTARLDASSTSGRDSSAGADSTRMPDSSGLSPVAATSPGCAERAAALDNRVVTDRGSATYLVDLPSTYGEKAFPLLIVFGAGNESAEGFRNRLGLAPPAADAAIVAYLDCPNGASIWDVPGDLPYFDALLSQLLERYCVDPARVFLVGYAQGGWFASTIACQRGNAVRGGALFAGTTAMGQCRRPVAMLVGQGDSDPVFSVRSGRNTRDFWARVDQCDTSSSSPVTQLPCVDYTGCALGSPVRYCEFAGGHELPNFAARAIWDFFRAQW